MIDVSTENVTLYAVFVNDILSQYEDKRDQYSELFDLAKSYDLSDPYNKVPIDLYNNVCLWIEEKLGKFNLIRCGRNVGETVFTTLRTSGFISANAKPLEVMQALQKVAREMIQDPKKRGWEIIESSPKSVVMRRTQSFNSKLQLGLLDGLVRKCKLAGVNVDYKHSVEAGDPYDDYLITWL